MSSLQAASLRNQLRDERTKQSWDGNNNVPTSVEAEDLALCDVSVVNTDSIGGDNMCLLCVRASTQ